MALLSARYTLGAPVSAAGELVGNVVNFLFDDVPYLVIQRRAGWARKRFLIPTPWVTDVSFEQNLVIVYHSEEQIDVLPAWHSRSPV